MLKSIQWEVCWEVEKRKKGKKGGGSTKQLAD
jgi:hypothetical protein